LPSASEYWAWDSPVPANQALFTHYNYIILDLSTHIQQPPSLQYRKNSIKLVWFIVYGNPSFLPQVMHKLNYTIPCDTGTMIDFKVFEFDVAVDKLESGAAGQ
jgi:hypothetical protein